MVIDKASSLCLISAIGSTSDGGKVIVRGTVNLENMTDTTFEGQPVQGVT